MHIFAYDIIVLDITEIRWDMSRRLVTKVLEYSGVKLSVKFISPPKDVLVSRVPKHVSIY